jgi:hypothetical protein
MQTWEEWRRLAFSPDRSDTTAGIDDAELALAIKGTGDLMDAAELLTEVHGHIVARNDIAARVEASAELQRTYKSARAAFMERVMDSRLRRSAEDRQLAKLQRERNRGPRCGARTRGGAPCRRKPVLGKSRCPNHGGASPVIGPGRRRT